jgi:hypothetical protein
MASLTIPFSFVSLQTIEPDQVNANFSAIVDFLNTQVAHLDGPTFTGIPVLPAITPTSALHAASKGYVDTAVASSLGTKLSATRGTEQGTTNGDGTYVVSHGLGAAVAGAVCTTNGVVTLFGGAAVEGKVVAGTSSTVTFKFWNGTSAYAGLAIKFHWIAWA